MINPVNYTYNGNLVNLNQSNLNTINETTAKHMPNGLLRVPNIENSKNNNHTFVDNKNKETCIQECLPLQLVHLLKVF